MVRTLLAAAFVAAAPLAASHAGGPLHDFDIVTISADGAHVASLEEQAPANGGDGITELVIRDTANGAAHVVALPCGVAPECRPGVPTWSPDSQHLAFSVRRPGSFARTLYSVAPDGSGLATLAAIDGTAITLRYSRDGRLAVLAIADADKEVGASAAGGAPAAHPQRIGIVANGTLRWASPPDLFVYEYDWRPDGSGFVGTGFPGADGDAHWWRAALYAFDAATATARPLFTPTDPRLQISWPSVAPDGRSVAFIGGLMSDFGNAGGDAWLLPLDRPAAPRNLTEGLKATVTTLGWSCDGTHVIAGLEDRADSAIASVPTDGAMPDKLWSEPATLAAREGFVSTSCATGTGATIRETFADPPEIMIGSLGHWRKLTAANAAIDAGVQAREIRWSLDGFDENGWLLLPTSPPPDKRLPMITIPHGGPAWAYMPAFQRPSIARALLDHGYALFMPNPRGSYGRGEAFTRANVRDFGGGDFRDVMAGVDAALKAGPIDPDRLGIEGVSYGGFMTMWAVGHTTRFRAAVARAGISDWVSYYGENGIGDWLPPYFGASLYDDPAIYQSASPIAAARAVRTPTLMMVGERDIECPPPQSQEFWHALTELGVPTGLVVYPGEGHAFRDPKNAADAETRILAWFDRYLH